MSSDKLKIYVPLAYAQELYDLRLHLALVRELVEKVKPGSCKCSHTHSTTP